MKILIIPSWYPTRENRTQGIFFLKQAELLARVHDTRVLAGKGTAAGYRKAAGKFFDLINLRPRKCDSFLDELEKVKLYQFAYDDFVFLPENKRMDRIGGLYKKFFSEQIRPDWQPDIIHAHDALYGGLAAKAIREAQGIPFAVTSHTPLQPEKWSRDLVGRVKDIFLSAGRTSAVSHFDEENIVSNFGQAIHPVTIGNYIDEKIFKPATRVKKEGFGFLYVTSTSTRKDFPTLFAALRLVKEKAKKPFILDIPVLEVNDGISIDGIKSLILAEGLQEQVRIHTNLSIGSVLVGMYQQADLFISSSYHETFGVATAEAISCGTPVIAVDNGGIRDIVGPGLNGWLVERQKPAALADYILRFMNGEWPFDPSALHLSIANKFGSAVFLDKLTGMYEKILNDQRN